MSTGIIICCYSNQLLLSLSLPPSLLMLNVVGFSNSCLPQIQNCSENKKKQSQKRLCLSVSLSATPLIVASVRAKKTPRSAPPKPPQRPTLALPFSPLSFLQQWVLCEWSGNPVRITLIIFPRTKYFPYSALFLAIVSLSSPSSPPGQPETQVVPLFGARTARTHRIHIPNPPPSKLLAMSAC